MSSRPAHCVWTEEIYDAIDTCIELCSDPCNLHESFPVESRDIVCPKCQGMLEDKPKSTGNLMRDGWGGNSNNLFCQVCRIEWRV